MKILSFLTVLVTVSFLVSCNKNDTVLPKEEIASQLPKQVFLLSEIDEPILYSIKYDTSNLRIELYYDDTSNANPYDILAERFEYNNSGYLINWSANYPDGSFDEKRTISRGSDNKIKWIAREIAFQNKDTTWFSYASISEGTGITATRKTYYEYEPNPQIDSYYYIYNAGNKLMQAGRKDNNFPDSYSYNPNGSMKGITSNNVESTFAYTSGLADNNADVLLQVLMGRDYYLQNLKDFYPFNLFYQDDYFSFSSTDPYHTTRFESIYPDELGQSVTDTRTYQYEMDHNRVSRITINWDSVTDWIQFKY